MCFDTTTSYTLLDHNFGTNPDARIYMSKYGNPSGFHAAAFCSTCNGICLSMSSMVLVAHNYVKGGVIIKGKKRKRNLKWL